MISQLPQMKAVPDTKSDDDYPYLKDDLIQDEYDQLDRLLVAEEENPRDLHFSKLTVEELISAQLHDAVYSEIHRKMDRCIVLRSEPTTTDSLSEPQILAH